jgi:hypothetical protein
MTDLGIYIRPLPPEHLILLSLNDGTRMLEITEIYWIGMILIYPSTLVIPIVIPIDSRS